MSLIRFPEITNTIIYTYVFYFFLGLIAFKSESSGIFNLPYSKFAKGKGISPRIGMFIIYFFPILAYYFTYSTSGRPTTLYHVVCLFIFCFHFGKRCLEVLFLHKFSGKIGMLGVFIITIAYSNIGLVVGSLQNSNISAEEANQIPTLLIFFGLGIFLIGQIGNFYHHLLLKKMRTGLEYTIPTTGMFSKLVCPHYFFELIGWFGIAIVSSFFDAYMILFIMTCYLSGRASKTKDWYLEKFPDFPKSKYKIFPYLY
jgi:hypothetical protein